MLLGDKDRFAAEVGQWWHAPSLRRVDLWAAGQWLTCDDNTAYVPQFRLSVQRTAAGVRAGHPPGRFLDWGPTTDNVIAHLAKTGDELSLTFEFWREDHLRANPGHAGVVFAVELPVAEFTDVLDGVVAALEDRSAHHGTTRITTGSRRR